MSASPIPEGYHSLTPYLILRDAERAIDFYKQAFGAVEHGEPLRMPGGKIGHAEITIGDSHLMLSEEMPEMGFNSPLALGGTASSLLIYVPDVDAVFSRAIAAGAKPEQPVEDKFWGDRMGSLVDPFGHRWSVGTHVKDVSPDEMQAAMDAMFAAGGPPQS